LEASEGFTLPSETICPDRRLINKWAARVDPDERQLVRQCLENDQDACARLVETYAAMVGTVIWRATGNTDLIEDLAQETFFRVFRGLRYFDARSRLSTWIFTIAHRVAIDHLRRVLKIDRAADVASGFSRTAVTPERNPEAAAADNELDAIVREQLHTLPEKYRLPLVYATLDQLDYQTIGAMLKVKPGTVKTLVFRGRQLLKGRVEAVLARRIEDSHAT
jgi:RNA polymerase sigma-70 factor (ECF subfamily)